MKASATSSTVADLPEPVFDPTSAEQACFVAAAEAAGLDPGDVWVGSYVGYEWRHLRRLLAAYRLDPKGKDVLEFGSNVGGSLVTLSALGGRVTGIDVDEDMVQLARANAARYGLSTSVAVLHVPDTRRLPFADGAFDMIVANSVLEYVEPSHLDAIIAEFHRVLRPGGKLLICGTASRLSPREIHSRRWLVNYIPRVVDAFTGVRLQRGLGPLKLARALRGQFEQIGAGCWRQARIAVHGRLSVPARFLSAAGRLANVSPGWISPNLELLLIRQ